MPEEGIETQELKEKLDEAEEHAHAEHHESRQWIVWLSLSTAIVAVLAAIASLESGSYANDAIVEKNDAILHQPKADDAWGYFQEMDEKSEHSPHVHHQFARSVTISRLLLRPRFSRALRRS